MLTIDKFEEASEVVKRVTQDTKLIFSDYFSQMTGNKVYFKPENMQRTGAYKLRGAYYKISTLTEEERAKGLITASAGNHAQGVAYAAKAYGAKLFLHAEHIYKESGQGEQKLKWVVQQARGLLPKWLQVIMSEEVLLKIIDWWFKEVKDLLDDGKVNGSQN